MMTCKLFFIKLDEKVTLKMFGNVFGKSGFSNWEWAKSEMNIRRGVL